MIKQLLKYRILSIISFDDSFFYTEQLPTNIKLSQELLELNYLKYSPYKTSNLVSKIENKQLFIWFYMEKKKTFINIPEAYILYKRLKTLYSGDKIFLIDKETGYNILVIKNGILTNAFTINTKSENILKLSINEYQILDIKKIEYYKYKQILEEAKNNLSIKDLFDWSEIDFDPKKILFNFIDKFSYQIAFLISFYIVLSFLHTHFLNKELNQKKEQYLMLKEKNKNFRKNIIKHNQIVKKWKKFVKTELIYPDTSLLLNSIYKVLPKDKDIMIYAINISNGKISLKIKTSKDSIMILNKLSSNKYFHSVIISNTYKVRKTNQKIISYEIEIKTIKEL